MQKPTLSIKESPKGLKANIQNSVKIKFLRLVIKAYKKMQLERRSPTVRDEVWFSAVLFGCMDELCPEYEKITGYNWDVKREPVHDSEQVLQGQANPNASPRIDIVVTCWKGLGATRVKFPFENKRLLESDTDLARLYIKEGLIDRYLNKEKDYASGQLWGGMIGYILQGSHVNIIDKLNKQIARQLGNSDECLLLDKPVDDFDLIYKSQHKHPNMDGLLTITHMLLYFLEEDTNT